MTQKDIITIRRAVGTIEGAIAGISSISISSVVNRALRNIDDVMDKVEEEGVSDTTTTEQGGTGDETTETTTDGENESEDGSEPA